MANYWNESCWKIDLSELRHSGSSLPPFILKTILNVYNSTFLDSYSVFARVWGNYSTSVMIVFRAQTLSALSSCPPLQANHSQQCRLGPCAKYFTLVIITNQHYTIHQLCQKFWQNTTPFYVLFLHLCTFPRTASAAAQSSCFLMHLTVSRAFIAFIIFDSSFVSPLERSSGRTKCLALHRGTPSCRGSAPLSCEEINVYLLCGFERLFVCLHHTLEWKRVGKGPGGHPPPPKKKIISKTHPQRPEGRLR